MAFFFVSCTERTSSGPDNREDERIYGWRWDDFKPVPHASKMYGGVREIYHVGEWVVLMDDFYSSNEYTSPGKVTSTPRVFASKIGSTQWDTLTSSEWIRYIYGDSTGLYAGTELSGKVLKYDFNQHKWDDLYQLKFNPEGFYNVYGIATYRGNLVVCFAGYEDSTDLRQENIKLFMKMQTDTGWVDITYDYDSSKEYPFQFHKGVELVCGNLMVAGNGLREFLIQIGRLGCLQVILAMRRWTLLSIRENCMPLVKSSRHMF